MPIAAVLVIASGGARTEGCLKAAAEVAERADAVLDILHVSLDPRMALPMVGEGMAAGMIQDVIERNEQEGHARRSKAREAAEALAASKGQQLLEASEGTGRPGFSITWQALQGSETEIVKAAAPYRDLIVLDRPDLEEDAYATVCVEAALMETGRAVLLIPPGGVGAAMRHIAIAWDGSAFATRAVAAALPFLSDAEQITMVAVEESGKTSDLGALSRYLACHGLSAKSKTMPSGSGDTGAVLLETAAAAGADTLVMGGYGHSRLREFIFGGVTESVLRSAGMPVLMAH